MRCAGAESGLLGFCRKLSRDVLQFADPLRLSSGGKLPRPLNAFRRSLQIEPLEVRCYLNGTSIAAQVDPVWFQEVASGVQSHAGAANWTAEGISASNNQRTVSINGASDTYDWIVQFDTQSVSGITNIAQTAALLAGGGIQFQTICGLGIMGQVLVRSSGAALDTVERWLAADADVAGFEEDAVRQIESTPNDASLNQLWGMSRIDAYNAWNIATGGSGSNRVIVAEIDTGVDYTHPDLAANIWTNPNAGRDGFAGDVHGYDFANNDGDPMDDNGHGTHVAGTIGAVGNNGLGVAGVNWAVSIMPLKFMTASGSGYLSDAIRAINYATMERTQFGVNVRVINASWGGGGYSAAMQTAIQAAGNAGILFVVAAGNDATNNDANPHYPASYNSTNIVAVAASDQSDKLASFSSYGATSVDLAAPGVSIYSTLPGNRYGTYSGTSMATPHVAGAAALAWALDPTASVAEIRNALLQGVDHSSNLSGMVASGGRLNVLHALQILQGTFSTMPTIGALAPSANNVPPRTSLDLIASGAAAPTGSVLAVYFYADINNNGSFDAGDFPIGADNSVVGGVGTIHFLSTNWTPGTYRFFARTLDSNYHFSAAATTTIAINATGMSSFTLSPNDIGQGATVSLIAQGLPTGNTGYRQVYYYCDSNNNGVLDAADLPIGTAANVNGTAQLSANIGMAAPGTYRYFARALGMNYQFAQPVAQTLTVHSAGLQSFSVSADNVAAGTTVQLLAQCPAALGNVAGVNFYADTNNNGVFDAQDSLIGSDMSPVNGLAKLAENTAGMAPGTYRFFARTVDHQNRFGPASTTTLTVVLENNQNSTPSAVAIAAGATLAGKLDTGGKESWYQFQAVAGTSYTIRTELVSLRDSMLNLYDRDGKTVLVSNDDGDSGLASRIDWIAPKSGTYFFKVSAFDKTLTGDYRVSLTAISTHSLSAQTAGMKSDFGSTGVSPSSGPMVNPKTGIFFSQRSALGDRFTANPMNNDGLPRNGVQWASPSFAAAPAIFLGGMFDGTSPVSRSDTITSTADRPENDDAISLLDRHPALRSTLGSMFFENELDAAEPVKSIQLDLEALDALFTRLAEDDLGR